MKILFVADIHNAPVYPDGSWIDRVGDTWVFNPGRQIGPCPTTLSIDLEAFVVEWTSLSGSEIRELTRRKPPGTPAALTAAAGA